MPYVSKVALGQLPFLKIFGNDYETKDGTGERDYTHVLDLAEGHMAALQYLQNHNGWYPINLGTGSPTSVLEIVGAFEKVANKRIKCVFVGRRLGDLPIYYANPGHAKSLLNWVASRSLDEIVGSIWKWLLNISQLRKVQINPEEC